jgi:hypothetical protein
MKFKMRLICTLLVILTAIVTPIFAQANDIENLFRDLREKAAAGITSTDEADPVIDRFAQSSKENVAGELPVILDAATDPHASVRGIAALALWKITTRPDGQSLLLAQTATFTALLTDPYIPIRRITGLAIANLRLNDTSPLLTSLESYLTREDATSTIGGGVAGLLMKAAPDNAESNDAIVRYMGRKDHTAVSRSEMLQSIKVTRGQNRELGKAVANWADDPDEQTSVLAIGTLQSMGKDVVLDNQQSLSRIAADTSKRPNVRATARRALTAAQ